MTLEELVEKVGIETIQSEFQEYVTSKINDDKVEFTVENSGTDSYKELVFTASFPDDNDKYVCTSICYDDFDEDIDEDNYFDTLLAMHAENLWEIYCDMPDELDEHQVNYVKKINNE